MVVFLYILLIGPMIEEKYGTFNLLIMMLITAGITGIINYIRGRKRILGASGIVEGKDSLSLIFGKSSEAIDNDLKSMIS